MTDTKSWQDAIEAIRALASELDDRRWEIGDRALAAIGPEPAGAAEKLQELADATGLSLERLAAYYEASKAFPAGKRNEACWTIHFNLRARPDRFSLLRKAAKEGWTSRQAEIAARKQTAQSTPATKAARAVKRVEAAAIREDKLIEEMTVAEVRAFNEELAQKERLRERRIALQKVRGASDFLGEALPVLAELREMEMLSADHLAALDEQLQLVDAASAELRALLAPVSI